MILIIIIMAVEVKLLPRADVTVHEEVTRMLKKQ